MNALNEINQVILNVSSYYPHHQHRVEEMEYLTAKRIAEWLAENQVLQIILRDSLHQPQYVEKMEKILRFIIKERSLTLKDLDDIWAAQVSCRSLNLLRRGEIAVVRIILLLLRCLSLISHFKIIPRLGNTTL